MSTDIERDGTLFCPTHGDSKLDLQLATLGSGSIGWFMWGDEKTLTTHDSMSRLRGAGPTCVGI